MTTISVVIPVFNRRELLARALASVLAQTRRPDEVIVVDDGSCDGTGEMVRACFPQVCYLRNTTNQGVSRARNRAIAAASGAWIALLDSDDTWCPHKLEAQLALLARRPELRVVHCDEIWIRQGRRVNPRRRHAKRGGWIFQYCLPLCAISPSAVMIHREVFAAVGLFDESLPACEDYDLWLRVTPRYEVGFVPEPLVTKFGGHADQLSRRHWGMDRFRIHALRRILDAGVLNAADDRAARQMLLRKIDIYLTGARKRGRVEEVAVYEALRQEYFEGL